MQTDIRFFKVGNVKSPTRGTNKSAGIDFYIPNDFVEKEVMPGDDILIPSGIKVRVPDGYALVANNKSGVSLKKKMIFGASVIDQDYTGIIHIHLFNVGVLPATLIPGEKIIQFILEKQEYATLTEASSEEDLYKDLVTERAAGAFGSTGSK